MTDYNRKLSDLLTKSGRSNAMLSEDPKELDIFISGYCDSHM